ncbi:hypothetical protein [Nocardia colli]|uniref:hypothetical protein n=1 Tax=Nocardia colli TaxID=2545717 RepID=UPI0035E0621F
MPGGRSLIWLARLDDAVGRWAKGVVDRFYTTAGPVQSGAGQLIRTDREISLDVEAAPRQAALASRVERYGLVPPDISSVPLLNDLISVSPANADDTTLLARLHGLNQTYGPYDAEMTEARYIRAGTRVGGISIGGKVVDDGQQIGRFKISAFVQADGHLEGHIGQLYIDRSSSRRSGFGTVFLDSIESYFRRSGAKSVYVQGAPPDGGKFFAGAGYGWDPDPGHMKNSIARIRESESDLRQVSQPDQALVTSVLQRFNGPEDQYPSPQEIVNLAGDDSQLGRHLMKNGAFFRKDL